MVEAKFLHFFNSKSQNYSEVSNNRDYLLNVIFVSISKGIEKHTISMKIFKSLFKPTVLFQFQKHYE